jgi:hypothetical protein
MRLAHSVEIYDLIVEVVQNLDFNRLLKKSQPALLVETKERLHVSTYARNRYPTEFDVQLPVTGRARTSESSFAADPANGRGCLEGTLASFPPTLLSLRPAIDSAREVIAGIAFAGAIYDSQRTDVDGATGINWNTTCCFDGSLA